MNTSSRIKKDYYGGALMMLVGLVAVMSGLKYRTGELSRMGPGFFPVAVGALLALIGMFTAISARGQFHADPVVAGHGHGAGLPDLRGCACIILGALSFMLFGKYGGLIPATFSIVFISALGDRKNTLKEAILLAAAMCVVAAVVFSWALQLQLQLFTWGA